METQNKLNRTNFHVVAGSAIVAIGLIMILDNLGLDLPSWLFSWSTILLGIGLWMGYRKDFKLAGWVILVIIGGVYTLGEFPFFDLSGAKGALVLIGLGAYMLFKPKSNATSGEFNAKKPIQF